MRYQRIVVNGNVLNKGVMDTPAKFKQLTEGVDLRGKRILDGGCNTGMMSFLAAQAGASKVLGIDTLVEVVQEAKALNDTHFKFPNVSFAARNLLYACGNWDVVIASAILHYIPDLRGVVRQVARITKDVFIGDIVVGGGMDKEGFFPYVGRPKIFVPTIRTAQKIFLERFEIVEMHEGALSPDHSTRITFHCSKPRPDAAKFLILHGPSNSGKTWLGMALANTGWVHIQSDSIFQNWYRQNKGKFVSVSWMSALARGDLWIETLEYRKQRYRKRLEPKVNRDVVLEGFDLGHEDEREAVIEIASELGWKDIEVRDMGWGHKDP